MPPVMGINCDSSELNSGNSFFYAPGNSGFRINPQMSESSKKIACAFRKSTNPITEANVKGKDDGFRKMVVRPCRGYAARLT